MAPAPMGQPGGRTELTRISAVAEHRRTRILQIDEALRSYGTTPGSSAPVAVLDLDAFDANARDLARRAAGIPIRVASKSLRVRPLIERALATPGFRGVLAYTLPEALWLVECGITDVVVAYPTADVDALSQLAASEKARRHITVMIDSSAHLDLIELALGQRHSEQAPIRVAIELDASYAPHARVRFGAYRSPLFRADQVLQLARDASSRRGIQVVGLMAYEAQIAGVGDSARSLYGMAVRTMKKLSATEIATRRAATVRAISQLLDLEFVNAGGTGSLETSTAEEVVTEVSAGSGLIGPGLFDHYRAFHPEPALLLGFSVVRRPAPNVATVLGGGWIASGAAGKDRLPVICYPTGLRYAPQEGAGEVQTPVLGPAANDLRVGDRVWLRHAKAGEPAEHATHYYLVSGTTVVDIVPTYRGEGRMFL